MNSTKTEEEGDDRHMDGSDVGGESNAGNTIGDGMFEDSNTASPLTVAHSVTNDGSNSESPFNASNNGPSGSQNPNHPTFRRQRAARACETCHARKVRCDAASLGVPCTNCVAFSIECRIPAPKRKKTANSTKSKDDEANDTKATSSSPNPATSPQVTQSTEGTPSSNLSDSQNAQMASTLGTYAQFLKPKFARAPIKEAGRVAYLGESSNLSLLVSDKHGTSDVVHYPLPENIRGSRARLTELDHEEIDILNRRGAFLLPPRMLCDELVEAFFKHIAPVVPVINRSRFMRSYRDPDNPPSLLLLQAILLAGSRVCSNPALLDANGSTTPAAMTFYKRAKALYDANYEDDRVTIVQSLLLMGWYWEGPEDVTKNVFYWSRVATIVAQGSGMHRSVERSQLSKADKRLWKRIWWTLFTRDRSVAVALGRPVHINTDDSDVEMVTEDDFLDDEPGHPAEYPPDPVHVQFFMHYVKLCEIMGIVLAQQYSVASRARRTHAIDLEHSDMALADWMINVPEQMRYHMNDENRQNFWAALLHSTYYTTLCLLHRAHMPSSSLHSRTEAQQEGVSAYPSRNIAFQAATNITNIIKNLRARDEIKYCPAFIVYSLFSALIMQVYQVRSSQPSIVAITQERMKICMEGLKEVSKVWLVAKMVYTLFESILGNKALEERLQKATNYKRSSQKNRDQDAKRSIDSAIKRKFDDMDLGNNNTPGIPVQQMSYERSRPQTPALAPSVLPNTGTSMPAPTQPIQNNQHSILRQGNQDAFMGGTGSRSNTRPPTPFQPSFSVPATPPDLYLVTRNSPPISQSLWENFQPNQLFPEDSGMINGSSGFSPPQVGANLAGMSPMDSTIHQSYNQFTSQQLPFGQTRPTGSPRPPGAPHSPSNNINIVGNNGMGTMWNQFEFDPVNGGSPEDTWSNSSLGQGLPPVPATLNVEDWFNFFGISGMDFNALGNNNNMGATGV